MAISPMECLQLTSDEVTMVKDLEQQIDMQLVGQFTHERSVVRVSLVRNLGPRVANEILRMYEKVGWDIGYFPESTSPSKSLPYFEFSKS